MKQVACPHCGFLNFAISAYCGRCERPLRSAVAVTPPQRTAEPSPEAPRAPAVPTQASPDSGRTSRTPSPAMPPATATPLSRSPPVEAPIRPRAPELPVPPVPVLAPQAVEVSAPRPIEMAQALLDEAGRHRPVLDGEGNGDAAAPPLSALANAGVEVTVTLADAWQLVAARVIDGLLLAGFAVLIAWIDVWLIGGGWHPRGSDWIAVLGSWLDAHEATTWVALIAAVVAGTLYGVVTGVGGGRTLGRMLTGTVLVHRSGRPLGAGRLLLRTLVSWLSLGLGGAGYFWAIVNPQHRTWHDLVSGTVVVKRHAALPRPSSGAGSDES